MLTRFNISADNLLIMKREKDEIFAFQECYSLTFFSELYRSDAGFELISLPSSFFSSLNTLANSL